MTDANEMCESVILDQDKLVDTKEEHEGFSCHEESASGDIPSSLLSYFESSKSRAAVCEKFILEDLEDITTSYHTKGLMPIELNKEMIKVNEQVTHLTENLENKTNDHLLYVDGEMQTLFTHNVSLCPDTEDEAETREYIEDQNYLTLKISALDAEEMQKKEQRRQREIDFQEELRKIMEAEKLRQMELELMEKRAQEKLEQELLLQQELISNFQKQVDKEKKMIEEELKKKKEEEARKGREKEERRKREEEEKRKMKEKEEKRKNEEDDRRKRQEERKRIEEDEKRKTEKMRLKEEDRRKKEEEQVRKKEEEEKRKREEEENKSEENEERKRKETQVREEEGRRNEEIKQKEKERKGREEKQLIEVTGKKMMEDEKSKNEEGVKLKSDQRKKEEERKKKDEEVRLTKELDVVMQQEMGKKVQEGKSEEGRQTLQTENKMMHDQRRRKEEGDKEKRMEEEKRHGVENTYMTVVEEEEKTKVDDPEKEEEERKSRDKEELRVAKELEVRMKQEDMGKNEVEGRSEEDSRKSEVENKIMHDQRKEEEGEEKRMDEEKRDGTENKYMTVEEEEETKDEEQTEEWEEEIKRQKEEEEYRNREKEIRLKLEMQENEASNRETGHGRDRKDHQERQEETGGLGKKEDGRHNREGVRENVETEEIRLKESNISKLNTEENDNTCSAGHPLKPTLTPSSPAPLHNESTDHPSNSRTLQHDQTVTQTIMYKTMDGPAALPCSTSCSSAACLSDHTEQKRLSWMKDCIPWSKLSLQNRRKQKASVRSGRGLRKATEANSLPPLCTHTLLQSTGCRSLQQVTTVTLEDLPGCNLSTLAQCPQLRSLTLRRCGLRSMEGISQLRELCYIDLQENEISFMECENMTSLRVLRLAHNKLSSIHGLTGAENLDVLDLSHNSITRIAGLESMRRLQRLSLDHNQLISTKGLRDVYTLLDLDCSHNHLLRLEGLENSALLHTLDLRANSLSEPPSLNNQVLLRELHLDDNSISSLQDLSACWLPLIQHLSAAQNRITQLPSMSDFVSLKKLDLRFNCLSEVQNVCDNLEGCHFLQEVQLTGNPLQQEHGWRATLQKALPGLRAIDNQQTDTFLSPPAVQQVGPASGCFLTFCQAQLQQTRDLQQHHSRELSDGSSSLDDAMRHFTITLKLAEEQRFAHEYGDTTVCDEPLAVVKTKAETLQVDTIIADYPKRESTTKMPPVILSRNNLRCSYWGSEATPAAESRHDTFDGVKMGPEPAVSKLNSGSVHFFATKGKATSFNLEKEPVYNQQDLHLKSTAAVVIQQHWRKYRQKFGNIHGPHIAEKGGERGGDGGKPEWGPSFINRSAIGLDYAATVIQAYWRGFSLRRRLASALAAVTWPDAGQDDTFEEVDMDEFIFDEALMEKDWTFSENSPPRYYPLSQQPLSLKPPGSCLDPSQYILPPPLVWSPKQAWVAGENVDSAAQRISPQSSNRSKSPASTSVLSGLSERSEKILEEWGFTDSHTALLMLKRAQKMKSKKEQKKHRDPSIRLAMFRNKQLHQGPVEARNRPARHMRNFIKVGQAGLGLQRGEQTEQVKQEPAQQWLHAQAAQSDRLSESEHFLPEINASILNGGRVQLVADLAYADRLHHASGSLASCSLAAKSCKVNSYPRRNSSGHTRKEVPSPKRVTSAPSRKERISFRDNPVQLSGGWGGGKKRDRVYK